MSKQKTPAQIVAFHQRQIKLANSLPLDVYIRIVNSEGITITLNQKPYRVSVPLEFNNRYWCFKSSYDDSHRICVRIYNPRNAVEVNAYLCQVDARYNSIGKDWNDSVVKTFAASLSVDEFAAAEYILKKAASYCSSSNAGGSDGITG